MLADGAAAFTKAVGLDQDLSEAGLGVRSQRYAMLVEDGVVRPGLRRWWGGGAEGAEEGVEEGGGGGRGRGRGAGRWRVGRGMPDARTGAWWTRREASSGSLLGRRV